MASLEQNIAVGKAALRAGSQDFGMNDLQTDLVDTLANLMHAAEDEGLDFDQALSSAEGHFNDEQEGE